MTLKSHITSTITTSVFEVAVENETYTYTEFTNEKGKVTDFELKDSNAEPCNGDAELLEKVQKFIDNLPAKA